MRVSLMAIKESVCQNLDAMAARIEQMLPDDGGAQYQREKNCDWKKKVKSW